MNDKISPNEAMRRLGVDKIFQQVKENHAKLDGCLLHEFEARPEQSTHQTLPDYVCKKCGGTMRFGDYQQYMRGFRMGLRAARAAVDTAPTYSTASDFLNEIDNLLKGHTP